MQAERSRTAHSVNTIHVNLPISRHSQKNLIFWDWLCFFSSWMREVKPNVFALKCCLTWALCCQHDLVNLSLKLWTGVGFSECFDVKSSFMWEKAMWILALKSHLARCNKTVRIPVMGWAALSHQEIMIAQQHKLSDTWAKKNFSSHHGLINISVCNTFVVIHCYTKQPLFSFNLHNTCIWDGKHWVWSQRVYRVIEQEYTQCFQKRKIRYGCRVESSSKQLPKLNSISSTSFICLSCHETMKELVISQLSKYFWAGENGTLCIKWL